MATPNDTIAALSTPPGVSAIAVLRVSGPDSGRIAKELIGTLPSARSVVRGDYSDNEMVLDDVLFSWFPGPNSYTGEDILEISCHGNPFIAQKILEDLLRRGCRTAGPGEFTQRAFLGGRMDLTQAEAVMDLIHARSERALAAANRHLRGAMGEKMSALIELLLGSICRVEAYIDFPEEDLPPEDLDRLTRDLGELQNESSKLLATNRYGNFLRSGIRTVILGPPNAGKSSVMNRFLGRDRALVSAEPGTTRDYLEEPILLKGHVLRLIDTAGLNPLSQGLEKLGIEKTLERVADADLYLLVLDASTAPVEIAEDVGIKLNESNSVVLLNKSDLKPYPGSVSPSLALPPAIRVSALTGSGFDDLEEAIDKQIKRNFQESDLLGVAINARHADALLRAGSSLSLALEKLGQKAPMELIASDMRDVLSAFEEISGRVDNERMLDRLFADFCIGK